MGESGEVWHCESPKKNQRSQKDVRNPLETPHSDSPILVPENEPEQTYAKREKLRADFFSFPRKGNSFPIFCFSPSKNKFPCTFPEKEDTKSNKTVLPCKNNYGY